MNKIILLEISSINELAEKKKREILLVNNSFQESEYKY